MESAQCVDDLSVKDTRGATCAAYQETDACGQYDSKGLKCEELGALTTCNGDFEASKACCTCKQEYDFCCNFGISSSNQVICELFQGSQITDQTGSSQMDPAAAIKFQISLKNPQGWFLIRYSDFAGGDLDLVDFAEKCNSYEQAVSLIDKSARKSEVAYQYWKPDELMWYRTTNKGSIWTK